MKAVVDTNVFVSSFWGGKPKEIIQLWCNGKITLCINQGIIDEYFRVLNKLGLENEEDFESIFKAIKSGKNLEFCIGTLFKKYINDDPDDDKFVNCAIELDASFIISGDKHLLGAGKIMDIEILKPSKFLEKFK